MQHRYGDISCALSPRFGHRHVQSVVPNSMLCLRVSRFTKDYFSIKKKVVGVIFVVAVVKVDRLKINGRSGKQKVATDKIMMHGNESLRSFTNHKERTCFQSDMNM